MSDRNLSVIIGDLLGVVPPEESELRAKLVSIRSSVPFTAPEIMKRRWRECADALIESCGKRTGEPWVQQTANIFTGTKAS